jgi:hypothetical protein
MSSGCSQDDGGDGHKFSPCTRRAGRAGQHELSYHDGINNLERRCGVDVDE